MPTLAYTKIIAGLLLALASLHVMAQAKAPLPSWNFGPTKQAIVKFVTDTTTAGSPNFVDEDQRIAVFDSDGTLWAEQPAYFQLMFALDHIRQLASAHPDWATQQPYSAIVDQDIKTLLANGEKDLLYLLAATHAGMTVDEFEQIVLQWLADARHPRFKRPYTDLVYQPMVELVDYLRSNGFKVFIVSSDGVEFMRPFAEFLYGVQPNQVVGSSMATQMQLRGGKPTLVILPTVNFVDDGPGKPVAVHRFIGRRPIVAFGNADTDRQMLQWTAANSRRTLIGVIHHTDGEREWFYDRASPVGKLDVLLNEANGRGWLVVDMKKDWNKVFPPQNISQ